MSCNVYFAKIYIKLMNETSGKAFRCELPSKLDKNNIYLKFN